MGLNIPRDLAAWQARERRRHPARQLARRLKRPTPAPVWVARNRPDPQVAVLLEQRTGPVRAALVDPLRHLPEIGAMVVAPFDLNGTVPATWSVSQHSEIHLGRDFIAGRVILATSHASTLAQDVYQQAINRGIEFWVVQARILNPYAPPLPEGGRLLAWSDSDAEFWASGRSDIQTTVVGSQLLWLAQQQRVPYLSEGNRPLYLGQTSASGLSRAGLARAAITFCHTTHGAYRPHPDETDHVSKLEHATFEGLGIDVDRASQPLDQIARPVTSACSTGLLEAAARGLPAFVWYPRPPAWLHDLWQRYGLRPWGGEPTPAPILPTAQPAHTVAHIIRERCV